MTKDQVMEIAKVTAGAHWMDEAHVQRFAVSIRTLALHEAAHLAEYKMHPSYGECANCIRELALEDL